MSTSTLHGPAQRVSLLCAPRRQSMHMSAVGGDKTRLLGASALNRGCLRALLLVLPALSHYLEARGLVSACVRPRPSLPEPRASGWRWHGRRLHHTFLQSFAVCHLSHIESPSPYHTSTPCAHTHTRIGVCVCNGAPVVLTAVCSCSPLPSWRRYRGSHELCSWAGSLQSWRACTSATNASVILSALAPCMLQR